MLNHIHYNEQCAYKNTNYSSVDILQYFSSILLSNHFSRESLML